MGQDSLSGKWDLYFRKDKYQEGLITEKADRVVLHFKKQRYTKRLYLSNFEFRILVVDGVVNRNEGKPIFTTKKIKERGIFRIDANQLIFSTASQQDTLQYKVEDELLTFNLGA